MATWPHISAKNKTDVLQEGLPTGSEGGLYIAGCTKHRWQSEPPSPGKNVMCTRWDTLQKLHLKTMVCLVFVLVPFSLLCGLVYDVVIDRVLFPINRGYVN